MTRPGGACLARPYIPPISNGFPFISAALQGFATDTVADQMTAQTHSYPPTQDPHPGPGHYGYYADDLRS